MFYKYTKYFNHFRTINGRRSYIKIEITDKETNTWNAVKAEENVSCTFEHKCVHVNTFTAFYEMLQGGTSTSFVSSRLIASTVDDVNATTSVNKIKKPVGSALKQRFNVHTLQRSVKSHANSTLLCPDLKHYDFFNSTAVEVKQDVHHNKTLFLTAIIKDFKSWCENNKIV